MLPMETGTIVICSFVEKLSYIKPGRTYAVSYTHLRAHETVLDLVCRLLLEKKKQNTQYQLCERYI